MTRGGRQVDWKAVHERLERARRGSLSELQDDSARRQALLDERARNLRNRSQRGVTPGAHEDVLVVRVGDENYGVPLKDLAGVIRGHPAHPLLGTSAAFLGILYERGETWPVFALAALLNLEAGEAPQYGTVLLLRDNRERLGLAVAATLGIRRIDPGRLSKASEAAATKPQSLVRGIAEESLPILEVTAVRRHAAIRGEG